MKNEEEYTEKRTNIFFYTLISFLVLSIIYLFYKRNDVNYDVYKEKYNKCVLNNVKTCNFMGHDFIRLDIVNPKTGSLYVINRPVKELKGWKKFEDELLKNVFKNPHIKRLEKK